MFKAIVIGAVGLALNASIASCQETAASPSKENIETAFREEVELRSYCPDQYVDNWYRNLGKVLEEDGLIKTDTAGTAVTDVGKLKFEGDRICFGKYELISVDKVTEVYNVPQMAANRYLDYVDVLATFTFVERPLWTQEPRYLEAAKILNDGTPVQRPFRFFLRNGAWKCDSQDGRGDCIR